MMFLIFLLIKNFIVNNIIEISAHSSISVFKVVFHSSIYASLAPLKLFMHLLVKFSAIEVYMIPFYESIYKLVQLPSFKSLSFERRSQEICVNIE